MQGVPHIFAASLVYVIAASIACDKANQCQDELAYAVSVGVISLFITGVLIVMQAIDKEHMVAAYHQWIAVFLALWWGVGASVGTFDAPFTTTSNGYFAAWAGFLFSMQYAYASSEAVRNFMDRSANTMRGSSGGGGAEPQPTGASNA